MLVMGKQEPCRPQLLGRGYKHLETLSTCTKPSLPEKGRPKDIRKVGVSWALSEVSRPSMEQKGLAFYHWD